MVFLDDLKIAKATPIHKDGHGSDVSNYRPISVLPCFPKILELLMYNRFIYFIYLIHYLNSITRSYKTKLHRASMKGDTLNTPLKKLML